ncbi:signal recognition particle 54 kDa protein, chloroplastic-like [Hibiscus syriacus]|uniref:signal recognition particle 54 kDa protein, chloroplastic-like n=1 Tax=Hibiscus syriacus TaxID=106335 RepID=UPI0019248652|nr:signal recognition particle 54 kDa protein, chloroplastic-like [Hibiscus syriacus]
MGKSVTQFIRSFEVHNVKHYINVTRDLEFDTLQPNRKLWLGLRRNPKNFQKETRGVVRAEMFGQLTSGLEVSWIKLKGDEVLTNENIMGPMCDIRRALFEVDASLVIRQVVQAISDLVVGVVLFQGVNPNQQLFKIVRDELIKVMGEQVIEFVFTNFGGAPAGKSVLQSHTFSMSINVFFRVLNNVSLAFGHAETERLSLITTFVPDIDESICKLVKQLYKLVDIHEVQDSNQLSLAERELMLTMIFVNVAARQDVLNMTDIFKVTTFNVEIGIVGAILTKLDRGSRDDAALSDKELSGKPIKLAGYGEHMEDLKLFYFDRMVGCLSGVGDVFSLVEKAQEVICQEDAENLQRKIRSTKFDLNYFLKQTHAITRMSSLTRVIGMIPGKGKVTSAQVREVEKNLNLRESMFEVMLTHSSTRSHSTIFVGKTNRVQHLLRTLRTRFLYKRGIDDAQLLMHVYLIDIII